jgi:hypothetical protein
MREDQTTINVKCSVHDCFHVWRFEPTPQRLRDAAARQLGTICPDPGNVLTFEPFSPGNDNPTNWTLRRHEGWAEPEAETIVARYVGDGPISLFEVK